MDIDIITLNCLVQENSIDHAFPIKIDRKKNIGQLKQAIKKKKEPEFNNFAVDRLKLWKVRVCNNNEKLNNLVLRDEDRLLDTTLKISYYFSKKPLSNYIHIIVKPPLPPIKLGLICKMELLSEGDSVEYLDKNFSCTAALHEGLLYTKDEKYNSFTKFMQAAKGKRPNGNDFHNLKINNMTYWKVCDKIYNLIFCYEQEEDEVTSNYLYLHEKTEVTGGQVICFISEEKGFINAKIPPQSPNDPLPTWKKIPQDLQKIFDLALDSELRPSFCEAHYHLVGMSIGYKRTKGKLSEDPAIILYVRQKRILRRGCTLFPGEILGYSVDIVEACVATPYGFGVSTCQAYQKNVKLGLSIGVIEPQRTSGTLGAIVYDKDSKLSILLCEHICRFSNLYAGTGTIINQPSHKDLDNLKQSFVELSTENEAYKQISEKMYVQINEDKLNSALAHYKNGMCENFTSKIYGKDFGIDAAFCIFANDNRTLCPNKFSISPEFFKKANLPENTCLNGFYTYEMFDDIDELDVFKVGRTTGLTYGKLVPIINAISIGISNKSVKFAKKQIETPSHSNITDKKSFIGYMKASLFQEIKEKRQQCYPTVWFDRQLAFSFRPGDFEPGDSGTSIVDREGKALGILHAAWLTENSRYAIASPYFAVFEALNIDPPNLANAEETSD
ncbi:12152_t:CDS:2 [Racocetra fulgida]|uniref:12152_t:CDS:1 n=1 Tax=Racocetra fulgida TaxID=60492 RepID=A0A9N8VF21_9GLOM|nr:12152_t:CDS:2 [Racocetra fulgida]